MYVSVFFQVRQFDPKRQEYYYKHKHFTFASLKQLKWMLWNDENIKWYKENYEYQKAEVLLRFIGFETIDYQDGTSFPLSKVDETPFSKLDSLLEIALKNKNK